MKKLLCLLLTLVMVLSLAACADADSKRNKKDKDEEEVVELEEAIVDTWTVNLDMDEKTVTVYGVSIDDVPMIFDFDEDGEVTVTLSDEAIAMIKDKLVDAEMEKVYAMLESDTRSREYINELYESQYGMSLREFMEQSVEDNGTVSKLERVEEVFDYEVDGDKLIVGGYELTAEIKDDKLIITESEEGFWGEVYKGMPVLEESVG